MHNGILLLNRQTRMKTSTQLARRRTHCLLLVLWLGIAVGATLAQQPDAPTAAKPDASPQSAPASADNSADPPNDATEAMFPHFKDSRFWLSGQANFIFQTHPDFHAPYSGTNSLGPHYDKATSRLVTLYTG